jgi:4-amino-4-deoxy-L-arabinose transferase-like glycosyltransferase
VSWSLVALLLGFCVVNAFWIRTIPFEAAPDEVTHYRASVEYILEHGRLPRFGVDDRGHFRANVITYNYAPQTNYILAAATAWVFDRGLGLPEYVGARAFSGICGIGFILLLWLALREVGLARAQASLGTLAITAIPQVIFVFSYVNNDAFSLFVSALVGYSFVCFLRRGTSGSTLFFAASVGLLFSAKYNFFAYVPPLFVGMVCCAARSWISWKRFGLLLGASIAFALLLSGGWYLRNYIQLDSVFGFSMPPERAHDLGVTLVTRDREITLENFAWLVERGFFEMTFRSFFMAFGGVMDVVLSEATYAILSVLLFFALLLAGYRFACGPDRSPRRWEPLMLVAGITLITFSLHIWSSIVNAYQAQGRYDFPILVPVALLLGHLAARDRFYLKVMALAAGTMLWLLLLSNQAVIREYGPARTWNGHARFPAREIRLQIFWRTEQNGFTGRHSAWGVGQYSKSGAVAIAVDLPSPETRQLRVDLPEEIGVVYRLVVMVEGAAGTTDIPLTGETIATAHSIDVDEGGRLLVTGGDPYAVLKPFDQPRTLRRLLIRGGRSVSPPVEKLSRD